MRKWAWFLAVGMGDLVLFLSALTGIGIGVAHVFGWLDSEWLRAHLQVLVLLVVSLILASSVVERRLHIEAIRRDLQLLHQSSNFGVRYFPDAESSERALLTSAQRATGSIFVVGAKSQNERYLGAIEEAVKRGQVRYYRLVDGTHITHQLHEHLSNLLNFPGLRMAWTPREKYANLCVTSSETILVLPSPRVAEFSAVALPGVDLARQYAEYLFDDFRNATELQSRDQLEVLCDQCSPSQDRAPTAIKDALRERSCPTERLESLGGLA